MKILPLKMMILGRPGIDFRNEPGTDDGGIKRDFFTALMHAFVGCGRYEGTTIGQFFNGRIPISYPRILISY